MNIGIFPSVNFTKQKRAAKPEISVCSRIIRLMNNQTKSQREATIATKEEKATDKNAVAIAKIVPQLGCVSQESDALVSQRGKQSRGNPMQKVLGSIRKVRFSLSTLRQASDREKKGPSLGKIQVKHPHQRRPYATKVEEWSHEETERQQRCARSKAWNFDKNVYKLKEKDKATRNSPAEEWVLPAASTKEPDEREFVVDCGASMHMVSKNDLSSAELETMRTSRSPTTVMTANGEVQTREATVYVKELDLFVTVMLLEETPAVLSLGKLCEDHGYTYHWTNGQKPHLTKNGKKINCNISNYVPIVVRGLPFVVPGLSTTSSTTPTPSSSSSSQDSEFEVSKYTENPVSERSGSTSEELWRNPLHNPTKKNTATYCMTCRTGCRISVTTWSMIVVRYSHGETMRLDIETLPVLLMNYSWSPRAKVGKHSVYTHFAKDPNCDICKKTKITRASCRRRASTVVPRAANFGDLITADHKVLSDNCESRDNHRYAVVVQDLATPWIQAYPCKTKTSQEFQRRLQKFLEPERKPKVIYTDNSLEFR